MTFMQALAQQPQWVQLWCAFMAAVFIATVVILLIPKPTRLDALIILAVNIANAYAVLWLFDRQGYTRMIALPHLMLWTPLLIYLWRRLADPAIRAPCRQLLWLYIATFAVSLAFDYADVGRYLLGERALMVNPARSD
jgi:hypothetical protein